MDNRQFDYRNFQPDPGVEMYAQKVLDRIGELAPYDSTAVGILEKLENGYWCSLDIYSRVGPFIARSFAGNPREAVDGLASKMEGKLSQWRKARFSDEDEVSPPAAKFDAPV